MKRLIILVLLFLVNNITANNLNEISEVLKHVETNYNLTAKGDGGDSWGILQIQESVIKDINRKYGTDYTHWDAFDEVCAEEIFNLYITMWTEKLEKREKRKATEFDIVRIWNGGPKGYKRSSTLKYLEKYQKYKEKLGKNRKNCRVKGKMGCIMQSNTHTYDIYLFKDKRMMYGVHKSVVHILPKKPTKKEIRAKTQFKLDI